MTAPSPDPADPDRVSPPAYAPQAGYAPPPGYAPQAPLTGYAPPGPPPGYPFPPPPAPPAVAPNGQPLAGFGERLGAHLIDGLVFGGVAIVIMLPVFFAFALVWLPRLEESTDLGGGEPDPFAIIVPLLLLQAVFLVVTLLMAYVYYVEMMFRTGQTLGKRVLKLRVVPLDPAGTLDRSMAARRFLVQHVGGALLPMFSYLDGLWQLWDKPLQQCLHDKFAKTVVVRVAAS